MRYCDLEATEFADDEFTLVRGELYLHVKGRAPLHTNDGAPVDGPPGNVDGPFAPTPEIGQDSDEPG